MKTHTALFLAIVTAAHASPRSSTNYSILTSATLLGGSWTPLTGGITSDSGNERTVTDTNPGADRKFYRVGVVKP